MALVSTISSRPRESDRLQGSGAHIPLVVDVDGTLIKTDFLHEAALQLAARHPLQLWRMPLWLAKGKAALKAALADFGDPGTASIPLRDETVAIIEAAQQRGRAVYLASASDRRFVETLANRVGGITGVFASDGSVNLSGAAKAARLVEEFGRGGFDYVADGDVDFPVWQAARKVLALTHGSRFEKRLLDAFPDAEIIARPRAHLREYARALRPHQWVKNALVFLPLVAGHFFDAAHVLAVSLAFACFCMAASSAYLINDLLDLPSDREHPRKRFRPFASGNISLTHGVALAAVLAGVALTLAFTLPMRFVVVLAVYWLTTLAYSTVLKRKIVIDVVTLGGLYALRVLAGVAALGTMYSQWLLMFCLFLFLALAIVKRCSELIAREDEGKSTLPGRGYRYEDLRALLAFGAAAAYGAVFVVTLYLSSPEVRALYDEPNRLWLICPILLYWITRVFMIANRGELHDDPLVFALTDRASWAAGACVVLVLALAV
jgi:4-hydroxybenzoate polyprenyltransferase/phosphoserine phosphatase